MQFDVSRFGFEALFDTPETVKADGVRGSDRQRGSCLRRRLDQHDGLTGDGLTPADGPDVFTGLGFDVDRRLTT